MATEPALIDSNEDKTSKALLVPFFTSDLAREEFKARGEVSWHSESVLLGPNSSIEKEFEPQRWIEFSLNADWQRALDKVGAAVRFHITVIDGKDCYLSFIRELNESEQPTIKISFHELSEGDDPDRLLRQEQVSLADLKSIRLSFRLGLVFVSAGSKQLFVSFLDHDAETDAQVAALRVETTQNTLELEHLSAHHFAEKQVTPGEQARLAEAQQLHEKGEALMLKTKFGDAKACFDEAYATRSAILGKISYFSIHSLVARAIVASFIPEDTSAAELFATAREQCRPLYGNQHPYYGEMSQRLALIRRGSGDDREIAELQLEAFEIRNSTLTEQHPDFLPLVHFDDFESDSRAFYEIQGEVDWTPWQCILNDRASVAHLLNGSRWVLVRLDIDWDTWLANDGLAEVRIQIERPYGKDCIARIQKRREGPDSTSLTWGIYESSPLGSTPLKEESLQADQLDELEIDLRHGLVELKLGEKASLMTASPISDATKTKFQVSSYGSSCVLNAISARAFSPVFFSSERSTKLAEMDRLRQQEYECYNSGKHKEAVELGIKVVEIDRELSAGMPIYSRFETLYYLAENLIKLQRHQEALPLLREAEVNTRLVKGENHPNYAVVLLELAKTLGTLGRSEEVESLILNARSIVRQVWDENHPNYIVAGSRLALHYADRGDYEKAIPLLEQAYRAAREAFEKNGPPPIKALSNLISVYDDLRDYERSDALMKEMLEALQSDPAEPNIGYIRARASLAFKVYSRRGRTELALPYVEKAVAELRSAVGEKDPGLGEETSRLGEIYSNLGDFTRAEDLLLEAQKNQAANFGKRSDDYAESLHRRATNASLAGNLGLAEELLKEAMQIRKELFGEDSIRYSQSLSQLGVFYIESERNTEAEPLIRQTARIVEHVYGTSSASYAACLGNLASLYSDKGDYVTAVNLQEDSVRIAEATLGKRHPRVGPAHSNLAAYYQLIGELAKAEKHVVTALELQRSHLAKDHPHITRALKSTARFYANLGDKERAVHYFREALNHAKQAFGTDHPIYVDSLTELVLYYVESGMVEFIEELLNDHHALLSSMAELDGEKSFSRIAHLHYVYSRLGDAENAKAAFERGLSLSEELQLSGTSVINFKSSRGLLLAAIKDYEAGEDLVKENFYWALELSRDILPSLSDAQSRAWVGSNQLRPDLPLMFLRAQEQWNSPEAYSFVWSTKRIAARSRVGRRPKNDARPEVLSVYDQLFEARRELAQLVSAPPDPDLAEQRRRQIKEASDRKEKLQRQLTSISPASAHEQRVRDAKIEDLLAVLPPGVAVVDFVRLRDWKWTETPIVLEKPDGTFEERTLRSEQGIPVYDAFVLRSDRRYENNCLAKWFPLGPAEPIEDALLAWRWQALNFRLDAEAWKKFSENYERQFGRDPTFIKSMTEPQQRLRKLLWEKLESQLDGIHTVVVIPDGDLHLIPWAALPGKTPDSYLLEDYAIAINNSGQELFGSLISGPASSNAAGLIAADIAYDRRPGADRSPTAAKPTPLLASRAGFQHTNSDRNWSDLPATRIESKVISNVWPSNAPLEVLSRLDASEERITRLLPQMQFAHLATHGYFDRSGQISRMNAREQTLFEVSSEQLRAKASLASRNPLLQSGIVLAGANLGPETDELGTPTGSDGILTAEEIVGLNLSNLELVTLSACETGLGASISKEGVLGLTSAFQEAGARSVISSLWKVDDNATQTLMTEFYRNLWQHEMPKLQALREAQLTMLRGYDWKSGSLTRGLGRKSVKVDRPASDNDLKRPDRSKNAPPFIWAAFQLSGDWL